MDTNASTNLYDLLVTKDLEPEILDPSGKAVSDPAEAELFSFDWKTPNKNYGTVVVLLGNDNDLQVYFGDNLGRSMEGEDKSDWYEFLNQLKQFATRNLLTFEIQNLNRLKYTMKGMAAIREGLFEGYYGTRKVSYSDQPKQVKLVIKHNKTLGEGDARFRYIESLFVETADGERFRVPTRSLTHGKMLARHVAEGGTPYDAFGQHINQMIEEIGTLSRFVRATRAKKFNDDAGSMIEDAVRHYARLKSRAKQMISQRGYREQKESFDPAEITEVEQAVENIRSMFVEQNIDSRIEQALPVLARMTRESEEFEQWADSITEGTWAMPETPEQNKRLDDLLANELPVGPDATNATEQLYDVLGDDRLFDQLQDLARRDADADARPLIQQRMKELGIDRQNADLQEQKSTQFVAVQPDIPPQEGKIHVLDRINVDMLPGLDSAASSDDDYSDTFYYRDPVSGGVFSVYYHGNTPRIRAADDMSEDRIQQIAKILTVDSEVDENLDTDGVMMTRPSNMSS